MQVQRQFVQVGERRVLVRHAGQGPAVVLLHQSPESSVSLLPWFSRLADRFAVFAPDTPGFGLSDPLPLAQPTVPDLASALLRLLDALGLQRVLLYGVHTGAAIAARLARDHPGRVAGLVCDGLSAFTAEERQPLLDGYLPPFEPLWDGTHLLWLWARIREQTLFFPWHTGSAAARIAYPLATPAQIHKSVMELLDAGDGYRAGYRAPLLHEHGARGAAQLQGPAWLLYRESDVLRPHLDRLPALPAHVQARAVADATALATQTAAAFDQQASAASTVDAAAAVAGCASPYRRIVATGDGELGWLDSGSDGPNNSATHDPTRDGDAELLLPDIGTPARLPADAAPGMRVLAIELPGHGASGPMAEAAVHNHRWLQALPALLQQQGLTRIHLRASGGACALAVHLAQQLGPRCHRLTLQDPLPLATAQSAVLLAGLPDLQPHATGAHLIAAWNWARLKHLFWPWLPADASAAIAAAAPPPRRVHDDAVEMLRAGPLLAALWQSALQQQPWLALRSLPAAVHLHCSSSQPEQVQIGRAHV